MEALESTVDEINVKLVILGQGSVGKTALINSFLGKNFPKTYIPSMGNTVQHKHYILERRKISIRINIWDVSGQKALQLNPISSKVYNDADIAFLVFDLSNPEETLNEINEIYLENLEKYAEDCQTIIVGNKLDLVKDDLRTIIEDYFSENIPLLLISAKTGANVNDAFEVVIYTFLQKWVEEMSDDKYQGIIKEYLDLISKSEDTLCNQFVNLNTVDQVTQKADSHLSKKVLTETDSKAVEIDKFLTMQEAARKLGLMKYDIIDIFNENLDTVKQLILKLKKTPIDSLIKTIDKTNEKLKNLKEEFESNLDSLIRSIR